MLIVIDRHSGQPVYRQLLEQVRYQAASGILAPGDELPSTRALSARLGLNPMTVSKAYGLLEREGVVERRPGRALVIKARAAGDLEDERLEELRKALAGTAQTVRQLGVSPEKALELFADLLKRPEESE